MTFLLSHWLFIRWEISMTQFPPFQRLISNFQRLFFILLKTSFWTHFQWLFFLLFKHFAEISKLSMTLFPPFNLISMTLFPHEFIVQSVPSDDFNLRWRLPRRQVEKLKQHWISFVHCNKLIPRNLEKKFEIMKK